MNSRARDGLQRRDGSTAEGGDVAVAAVLPEAGGRRHVRCGSVLEERSTKQVPERAALSPRLLADLVRPLTGRHDRRDHRRGPACLQVAQTLDSPGTAEPGLAAASTASARPAVTIDHLTNVRVPALVASAERARAAAPSAAGTGSSHSYNASTGTSDLGR